MNPEESAKRHVGYRLLTVPEVTRVEVAVPPHKGWELVLTGDWPPKKDVIIWADFKTMTLSDEWLIDHLTRKDEKIDKDQTEVAHDYEERKRLVFRFLLRDWNLDVNIEREESSGWLTERCWEKIMKLPGPILEALVSKYQDTLYVSTEEEEQIVKQCSLLFSKAGKGVKNACDAVSLYCTLGNFWEKFGLNRFDLARLPYREYIMLRMVLGHDIERQRSTHKPKGSQTKIAGPGGRVRPSRGIVVDDGD